MTDTSLVERLRGLIERLEKLEGPDREVDAEVMFDLFAKPVGQKDDGGPMGYLWPDDNPSWSFGIRFPGKDREWFARTRAKTNKETLLIERDGAFVLMNDLRILPLTASIDAAVDLVERVLPEWTIANIGQDDGKGWHAELRRGYRTSYSTVALAGAPLPAIALVIAALRALQEQSK